MSRIKQHRATLFVTTAIATLAGAHAALAQPAAPGGDQLEEVVVTATRQADTVNRVPLAVTAQTQRALDQQGIRTIQDLQATVPGLRITGSEGSGVANISIRGIRQQVGAATTGFYLDDTSLQKRNAAGFASQNGTPIPPLFDLDRVEVLRGPQGTLFGGGSEGGTVRYIQPAPSLTRFSQYARAQYSQMKDGDASYEAGVAMGGPIIQDKLGFRASIFARKTGGFIDLADYRTGKTYDENANSGKVKMGRLALTWAPSETSRVTFSYFSSHDETAHNSTTFSLDVPGTVTVPTVCYNVAASAALPVGNPGRFSPAPFASGAGCAPFANQPGYFTSPGYTLGPLDLKNYQSLVLGPTPTSTDVQVASLDIQFDLPNDLTFHSITSYIDDLNKARQPQAFQIAQVNYAAATGGVGVPYTVPGSAPFFIRQGLPFNPNVTASINGLGLGSYVQPTSRNARYGLTQELRLASSATQKPLSFVAGVYFSNIRQSVSNIAYQNELGYIQMTGANTLQRFGVPDPGFFTQVREKDKDVEIAAFGEATLHITDKLRASGGIRVTHITTSFDQANFGPNSFSLAPSAAAGSAITGSVTEDPVTPKASLQYSITDNDLVYATAAKGFRAGGVNQVISSVGALQLFNQYGLTPLDLPRVYGSDSVWSYEVGGKFRLLNGRAQINAAAYRIDWTNVQSNVALGGDGFVVNAPSARSQGAELEAQLRPIRNLTLNTAVAYSKAKYTSAVTIPGTRGANLLAVQNGAIFPLPQWTLDVGARYDVDLTSASKGYARIDYRWSKGYELATPGSPNFTPDASLVPAGKNLNLRFGIEYRDFDINVFANNVTNYQAGPTTGGRSQCTSADCSTYIQFNPFRTVNWGIPRQIGVQVAYRH